MLPSYNTKADIRKRNLAFVHVEYVLHIQAVTSHSNVINVKLLHKLLHSFVWTLCQTSMDAYFLTSAVGRKGGMGYFPTNLLNILFWLKFLECVGVCYFLLTNNEEDESNSMIIIVDNVFIEHRLTKIFYPKMICWYLHVQTCKKV